MTTTLIVKLDELHMKVNQLAQALEQTRMESRRHAERADAVASENAALLRKLEQAQGQINSMINQWFPELDLNEEAELGSS